MTSPSLKQAFSLSLFLVTVFCHLSQGTYMSLMPTHFNPGWPFNIAVTIHKTIEDRPVKATVQIVHMSSGGVSTAITISDETSIMKGETKLLQLQIPNNVPKLAPKEGYSILLFLTGGLEVSNSRNIYMNINTSLIMVQSDKNIYKPGQNVLFRVLNMNKRLQPMIHPLSVIIVNPSGSKLERFDNMTSSTGVIEKTFELSNYASLGTWQIQVMDLEMNLLHTAPFLVQEFVLPKFSVEVNSDPGFLIWNKYDESPTINVKAIYTYGKAVQGECKLTLSSGIRRESQILMKKIPSTGLVEFTDIDWSRLAGLIPTSYKIIDLLVEVEDETGRKETASNTIKVYRSQYRVEILPSSTEILRNKLPAKFHIKVEDHFGNLAYEEIEMRIKFGDYSNIEDILKVGLLQKGQKYITFAYIPQELPNYASPVTVQAYLKEDPKVSDSKTLMQYTSDSNGLIQVKKVGTQVVKKGEPVRFVVESNVDISGDMTLFYLVVSQGEIVEAGTVFNKEIELTPTMEMCPEGHLVVCLIEPTQTNYEVVIDSLTISPSMCLDKKVSVTFAAKETRIGASTDMNIQVDRMDGSNKLPGIHDVYYLAVDKSITLLQGNTDMDKDKVLESLGSLNNYVDTENTGSSNAGITFKHLRLEILGNVSVYNDFVPEIAFAGRPDGELILRKNMMVDDSAVMEKNVMDTTKTASTNVVRKDFPDTWLWHKVETSELGKARKSVKLPDTITSWHVSAFAINREGLAFAGNPFELVGFQPFFLSMNLPYSLKRGEIFTLRITVFNYRGNDVDATVYLKQNPMFSVIDMTGKNGWVEIPVKIEAGLAASVEYKINGLKIGTVEIEAAAEDSLDGQRDQVIRKLLIKPEGEKRMNAITSVMSLGEERQSLSKVFQVDWPYDKIIPDSQLLQVKVTGEVFGQALSGLENLVTQPTGCGEQNMITTVPNIYGLSYIKSMKQKNMEDTSEKLISNMRKGYAREVDQFRHKDGSYSAWGPSSGNEGSTWLTAFVIKSFAQASEYISVDSEVLESGMQFIQKRQGREGNFIERGEVLHKDIQTGTTGELGMTVYCLMSMLETQEALELTELGTEIEKATGYIVRKINDDISMDSFTMAMTVYTLSLVPSKSPAVTGTINQLLARLSDSKEDWSKKLDENADADTTPLTSHGSQSSLSIQTAAYLLLARTQMKQYGEAMDLMKWIQSKQNAFGGYVSTQDTVLSLQALSEFGKTLVTSQKMGTVLVEVPSEGFKEEVDISNERAILLQIVDLPSSANTINVTLTSPLSSLAVVKVVYFYNTLVEEDPSPAGKSLEFEDSISLSTRSYKKTGNVHQVIACVNSDLALNTEMYVTTMELPSGEIAVETEHELLQKNKFASRVEIEEEAIHFYMNEVPKKGVCLLADIERQMEFDVQQPGSARFYSYYEPEIMKEVSMPLKDSPSCTSDPCERGSAVPLTSLFMSILICTMISLLVCM